MLQIQVENKSLFLPSPGVRFLLQPTESGSADVSLSALLGSPRAAWQSIDLEGDLTPLFYFLVFPKFFEHWVFLGLEKNYFSRPLESAFVFHFWFFVPLFIIMDLRPNQALELCRFHHCICLKQPTSMSFLPSFQAANFIWGLLGYKIC